MKFNRDYKLMLKTGKYLDKNLYRSQTDNALAMVASIALTMAIIALCAIFA